MKSTKTILAVAIVIAGFAYAANAYPPGGQRNQNCCSPQPEDIRVYRLPRIGSGNNIIIPKVEGTNGFMLTDVRSDTNIGIFQNAPGLLAAGPVEILRNPANAPLNLRHGFPLVVGATITVQGGHSGYVTIIGYVY